ncbi:DEAD/DEAH box helicase family protein [Myxosarcina sp. GI1]|uniref:DEAD/DEAH box helicase family protein n=1 Tax=Myxosarcina sp. GI1 TaxID=1541065 RepID=UPI00068B26DC|nr:DEAD/DEAH box helicase family protein [Myxosarcina sp. GI1]
MGLDELTIQDEYRSNDCSIVQNFYIPCLEKSIVYKRAVGFFSSSSMAIAGKGLKALIHAGGKMQLIASPKLSDEDIEAISKGLKQREEIIAAVTKRELEQEFDEVVKDRLACLAWLLSQQLLDIKLAVPINIRQKGIYHEKLGVFEDTEGNIVAFTGSANESSTALIANFECIDVFCSWKIEDKNRTLRKASNFNKLWNNQTNNLDVIELPEAAKKSLLQLCPNKKPELKLDFTSQSKFKSKSVSENRKQQYEIETQLIDSRWRHQTEAKNIFFKHRCGILEMATGTGKTRTAISILQHLVNSRDVNTIIITTIGTDLLDQWVEQLYEVASNLNPQFRVLKHYKEFHEKDEYELDPEFSILIVSSKSLRNVLRILTCPVRKRLLIIYDEAHSFGSPQMIEDLSGLSDGISYRLGLSATPEREYDLEGTKFLEEHIGSVIYKFSLEKAIRRGILCEFDYYPIEYEPSDEDKSKIQSLYRTQQAKKKAGKPMSKTDFWNALARVHKVSTAKLPYFEQFIVNNLEILEKCIIFVEEMRYGDKAIAIIHKYIHNFHTYYSQENQQKLLDFADGKISCLITCDKLSQGIDIQSLQTVILFSSDRAKLKTIQRIGRCLRKDPNNPRKKAIVVDLVRNQDENKTELNSDQARKEWLTGLSKIRCEFD